MADTKILLPVDKSITECVIPNDKTFLSNDCFANCQNLIEVKISNTICGIGNNCFANCVNLLSIEIPDSVTSIGDNTFSGCTKLTYIKLSNNIKRINYRMFYNCKSLKELIIPDSVEELGKEILSECNMNKIVIGNGIKKISTTTFRCFRTNELYTNNQIILNNLHLLIFKGRHYSNDSNYDYDLDRSDVRLHLVNSNMRILPIEEVSKQKNINISEEYITKLVLKALSKPEIKSIVETEIKLNHRKTSGEILKNIHELSPMVLPLVNTLIQQLQKNEEEYLKLIKLYETLREFE